MNNEAEPSPDVFDMTRSAAAAGPNENDSDAVEPNQSERSETGGLLGKLKKNAVPVAIGAAFFIGSVWIVMPELFSVGGNASTAPQVVLSQPTLSPVDAMRNAGHANDVESQLMASQPPAGFDPEPPAAVDASVAEVAPSAAVQPEPAASAATHQAESAVEKELQGRVGTLEQSVTELQAKIALLEGRLLADAGTAATNAKSTKPAQVKKQAVNTQNKQPPGKPVASKSTSSKPARHAQVNKSFTLNTIYPGQAWIQDADQAYAVRVGDVVGDMKILRIDPKGRRVETTKGEIR